MPRIDQSARKPIYTERVKREDAKVSKRKPEKLISPQK